MKNRTDYGQLAAKLDYPVLAKKLEQLGQQPPPKRRKTAADALEPLRERLLELHRKGWTSGQLVEELKAAGVPVSPARFRECLSRWNGRSTRKARANRDRRPEPGPVSSKPAAAAPPSGRGKSASGDGQPGLKLTQS
jgi:hypothetical protein